MNTKKDKIITYLSLFVMTIITIVSIVTEQSTVFYILYLFWFDEFIRTVFDRFRYYYKKDQIQNLTVFLSNNKQRFFLLSNYFIFIILIFGLVIDRKNFNLIGINLSILMFQNPLFNYTLISFMGREFYLYKNISNQLESKNLVSIGIIILHVSLVLGVLLWTFSSQKFQFFKEYAALISIIPFLLLKLIFEIKMENQSD